MPLDHPDRTDYPEMDPARSAEIRALLIRTVIITPRPRRARLSRRAFALAASAALLFAGGVGAGTVVAYDRLANPLVAQDSSAYLSAEAARGDLPEAQPLSGFTARSADAAGSESASDSDLPARQSGGLTPVLTIDGETGYAYSSDIALARTTILLDAGVDYVDAVPAGQIPIYRVDGVTLLGYVDATALLP